MLTNAVDEDTLEEVCREKQAIVDTLPCLKGELEEIDHKARIEHLQFEELTRQHHERLEHLARQRRGVLHRIGKAKAAGGWLRVSRPLLNG